MTRERAEEALVAAVAVDLREAIESKGFTLAQVAAKLGVDDSRLSQIVSGRENLTLKTIAEVYWAIGLGVPPFGWGDYRSEV